MSTGLDECAPVGGIDRADLILKAFDDLGRLTLSQISRRTGVPRSSVHRMLDRLVALRWIRRDGHHYQLGLRLVELGTLAVQQDRLHAAALPFLRELRRVTGSTVHLAVLDCADVVYLEKLEGVGAGGIATRVGGRRPAAPTSVGKVLLANVIGGGSVGVGQSLSVRQELAAVRQRGVAFDRGEALPHVGCIGAPVGGRGDVVAAVSICGPLESMTINDRIVSLVQHTGHQIHLKLSQQHTTTAAPRLTGLPSLSGGVGSR
ncbi:IclR family transcriptional regulator [Mycobacterium sp. CVI_P3]|uniref:IclR family transcriptional regulator n=2 Tax=Mycobacterium pinniadriaticum TaxID=2994102 RepID=A0ABT3SEL8_9MYCO|nr:IclR family transcriptional regulator [Mycobacterium pinniadriaticum]MCX2931647.1 IclR family transcriptional regulator [Mycobacterium pinniadriaticum]MCX2937961.1 IclR family transcriptional regulator [Mycobacterium pinniadriaticum]